MASRIPEFLELHHMGLKVYIVFVSHFQMVALNRPFPSSPGPLSQNEGRCSAFDVEIFFHSHANKTHFHKKGSAPSLIVESEGFWNS